MKTTILTTFILILSASISEAQERKAVDLRSNLGLYTGDLMNFYNEVAQNKMMESFDIKAVKGSPYLNNEFIKGELVTTDSIQYSGLPLRFNIYNDAIEFRKDNVDMELNEKFPLLYAVIDNTTVVKAKNEKGYFLLRTSGPLYILEKMNVKYVDAKPASGYRPATKPEFKSFKPDYYIQRNIGENAYKINDESDVLNLIPDKKQEVKDFIKKEKLKVSKQADLVEIVNYYKTLQ
jgi:hypothetical protein